LAGDNSSEEKIAIQWGNIICTHLDQMGNKSILAEGWGSTLLEINWRYILAMWSLGNEQSHGANIVECTKSKKQKLTEELHNMLVQNKQDLSFLDMEMIDIGITNNQMQHCIKYKHMFMGSRY
jgi:hypothetical protein